MSDAPITAIEPDAALDRLASSHGILLDYQDVWGGRRVVADGVKRGVLTAMGVPCDDAAAVQRSLGVVAARDAGRMLDPVRVVLEAKPLSVVLRLPERVREHAITCQIIEEHGATHGWECRWEELAPCDADGGRALTLDVALPTGYHQIHVSAGDRHGDMSLIVTPERCHLPAPLTAGERWWGLAAQLYGIRRERDWGIGDFSALPPLLNLCARRGAAVLGLSPLHAMFPTWADHASPYAPSSRLFLNVLFIDLERAADVASSVAAQERLAGQETLARIEALRKSELVDYPGVASCKLPILELAFADFAADTGSLRYGEFQRFCETHGDTLLRHAIFEALHEHFHGLTPEEGDWRSWPRPYQDPASAAVVWFAQTHAHRVDFYRWLQWLADEQLSAAARHAEDRNLGVGLYLDLAVSVAPDGAETWCNRHLYAMDAAIGAPPDLLSVNGQNWGLPPLNPRGLFESGYALFAETLRRNMRHAGALRIDHVMGLMRLFWIPKNAAPGEGAYVRYPLDDLLGIIALESQRNQCMVVGEDLGTVPEGLYEKLQDRGILSYRLLYFEQEPGGRMLPPDEYPPQALVAVSTHDLPTLAGWWQGGDLQWRSDLGFYPDERAFADAAETRNRDRGAVLGALGEAGLEPEGDSLSLTEAVHRFVARTPAMLLLVQLEDALGVADQANLPGTVYEHPNWRRRMPATVERLAEHPLVEAVTRAVAEERPQDTAQDYPVAAPVVPLATYRLQLHGGFTFEDARRLVPYLRRLGISHVYASPYLQSRAGSTHGYDITDHAAIDSEIGSPQSYSDWITALHGAGMSHVLDIVPNHMGVMGDDNSWWSDVLEHGEASRYSRYFDIDWHPPERALAGKVLLPVLGTAYGTALDSGELVLTFSPADGRLLVRYHEHAFPIDPREYPLVLEASAERPDTVIRQPLTDSLIQELASISAAFSKLPRRSETGARAVAERYRDSEVLRQRLLRLYREVPAVAQQLEARVTGLAAGELHPLLERQAWRLAHWRTASDEINYRRFFDINNLAALQTQDPEVFEAVHQRVLSLVEKGMIGGLRVDHPDGLYDPAGYFQRLRGRCADVAPSPGSEPIYLVAEKILAVDETLPDDWELSGTTGYDFSATVNGVFVDPAGKEGLTDCYESFIGARSDLAEGAYHCKHLVMGRLLAGELKVLGNRLHRIAQSDPHTRDYTRNSLTHGLRAVVACFPVYRTYVRGPAVSDQDRAYIESAIERARIAETGVDSGVFDFLGDVLLQRGRIASSRRQAIVDFTMKLQQFTAPVTAKGVEDTLFYRHARLLSLNEVGDDPGRFGVPVAEFHRRNVERLAGWPHSLLGTSSHDSKRGEDARARLNVLSEIPEAWTEHVSRWRGLNASLVEGSDGSPCPSRNDQYFLYQTLVGSWPLDGLDDAGRETYRGRICEYMRKVVREAKRHSSWVEPDNLYEAALDRFISRILDPACSKAFLDDLQGLLERVAPLGLLNGLGQTTLKLTSPGVPDIYQGSELWNFALVDPDNRRPVDYELRQGLLDRMERPSGEETLSAGLLERMVDGWPKLHVIRRVLRLRARVPRLFSHGAYVPLPASGIYAEHVCAFARQDSETSMIVIVPRLLAGLCGPTGAPPLGRQWQDTCISLPGSAQRDLAFLNELTGARLQPHNPLSVAQALADFPVAVLVQGEGSGHSHGAGG